MARALDLIDLVAAGGPSTVSELAVASGIPAPTTHRLLRTMVECGDACQLRDRRYALGFRLVSLGLAANGQVGASAHDVLADLVEELGETANLAVLSGNRAEYVAQVPSRHAMRMFIEVGRRVELHCTGVGKALLAQLDDRAVSVIVARSGMPPAHGQDGQHPGPPAGRAGRHPARRLCHRRRGTGGWRPVRGRPGQRHDGRLRYPGRSPGSPRPWSS